MSFLISVRVLPTHPMSRLNAAKTHRTERYVLTLLFGLADTSRIAVRRCSIYLPNGRFTGRSICSPLSVGSNERSLSGLPVFTSRRDPARIGAREQPSVDKSRRRLRGRGGGRREVEMRWRSLNHCICSAVASGMNIEANTWRYMGFARLHPSIQREIVNGPI
jgi:hypothetical protein